LLSFFHFIDSSKEHSKRHHREPEICEKRHKTQNKDSKERTNELQTKGYETKKRTDNEHIHSTATNYRTHQGDVKSRKSRHKKKHESRDKEH
jgi:hypothetical protein